MAWSRFVPVGFDSSGLVTRSAKEPPAGVVSGFSDMVRKSGGYLRKPERVGEGKVEGLVVG